MSEPVIVAYGREFVGRYPKSDLRAPLHSAFFESFAEAVILDSNPRNQKFLAAAVAWGIDEGLLYNDQCEGNGQQVVCSFSLTPKGKREFRVK